MRILFAIKAMNNPGGGAERVLADVANGLAGRGHEVALLTFERPGGQSFYPLDAAIRRIDLGIGSTTARARPGETIRRIRALRRAVSDAGPDVTIAFMHSMYIPLGLAMIGTGRRIIASEHGVYAQYGPRPAEKLLLRCVPHLVERIVCVSEQARAQYPARLQRAMSVISNPAPRRAGRRADVRDRRGGGGRLLSVGRLTEQKGFELLLEAFATIAPDLPDWTLRIVGDGQERGRLEMLRDRLGLEGRVELPGSTSDIGSEYADAQLYVVPSRYESFGLATAEAIAHGLPAIGFADCPGTNRIIRHDVNGLLVAGGDRKAQLAGALKRLMSNEAERLRLSRPDLAPPAADLESVLDAWEALLASGGTGRATKLGQGAR